jgi:hypothetical protein
MLYYHLRFPLGQNKLPTQHTLDEISALQVDLDIIRLRQIGIGLSYVRFEDLTEK